MPNASDNGNRSDLFGKGLHAPPTQQVVATLPGASFSILSARLASGEAAGAPRRGSFRALVGSSSLC